MPSALYGGAVLGSLGAEQSVYKKRIDHEHHFYLAVMPFVTDLGMTQLETEATCFPAGIYLTFFEFTFNKVQQAKHSQAQWEEHTC